jgi:hypothetical protein
VIRARSVVLMHASVFFIRAALDRLRERDEIVFAYAL